MVLSCTAWGVALGAQVPGVGQYLSVRLGFLPQAIYKLKKACRVEMEAEQQSQLLTPEEVVDRIFLLVDENGDGNRGRDGGGHPLRSTLTFWPCDLGEGPPLPDNWSSSVSWVWRRLREITKGVTST